MQAISVCSTLVNRGYTVVLSKSYDGRYLAQVYRAVIVVGLEEPDREPEQVSEGKSVAEAMRSLEL